MVHASVPCVHDDGPVRRQWARRARVTTGVAPRRGGAPTGGDDAQFEPKANGDAMRPRRVTTAARGAPEAPPSTPLLGSPRDRAPAVGPTARRAWSHDRAHEQGHHLPPQPLSESGYAGSANCERTGTLEFAANVRDSPYNAIPAHPRTPPGKGRVLKHFTFTDKTFCVLAPRALI